MKDTGNGNVQITVKVELPERFVLAIERLADALSAQGNPPTAHANFHGAGGEARFAEHVLRSLRESSVPLSRADLAIGVSDREWLHTINRLLESGEVIRTGEKKGTRYQLASHIDEHEDADHHDEHDDHEPHDPEIDEHDELVDDFDEDADYSDDDDFDADEQDAI